MLKNQTRPSAPKLDIHGAFVRRIDLNGTSLRDANLSQVDAANATFRNADFAGASLRGAILRGADLSGATNLAFEQLSGSVVDERTILPSYIDKEKLLQSMAGSR